jgi:hypothetical protein
MMNPCLELSEFPQGLAESALITLASPSWRGIDGDVTRVTSLDRTQSRIVKLMHSDADIYIHLQQMYEATQQASDLAVGAQVVRIDPSQRALVFEDLAEKDGWRACTLDMTDDRDFQQIHINLRKRFSASARLTIDRDPFAEVQDLYQDAIACQAPLPADTPWLLQNLELIASAVRASGIDRVAVHGDGNISNVMVHTNGAQKLLDWDSAGNLDPYAELGMLLAEFHLGELEKQAMFEMYEGRFNDALFQRAHLYGAVDHIRWALIGAIHSKRSKRSFLEFTKFSDWHFFLGRMAIGESDFAERLRRV